MFKSMDMKVLLMETYGLFVGSWQVKFSSSIPYGYEITRVAIENEKVRKGEIYLTKDFMISFPLTQDEEVEEGHAVIVLRPTPPVFKTAITEVDEFQRVGLRLTPFMIYGKTPRQINEALHNLKKEAYAFRVVQYGEQYLVHDCKRIATHGSSHNNANHNFVRLIVK